MSVRTCAPRRLLTICRHISAPGRSPWAETGSKNLHAATVSAENGQTTDRTVSRLLRSTLISARTRGVRSVGGCRHRDA